LFWIGINTLKEKQILFYVKWKKKWLVLPETQVRRIWENKDIMLLMFFLQLQHWIKPFQKICLIELIAFIVVIMIIYFSSYLSLKWFVIGFSNPFDQAKLPIVFPYKWKCFYATLQQINDYIETQKHFFRLSFQNIEAKTKLHEFRIITKAKEEKLQKGHLVNWSLTFREKT